MNEAPLFSFYTEKKPASRAKYWVIGLALVLAIVGYVTASRMGWIETTVNKKPAVVAPMSGVVGSASDLQEPSVTGAPAIPPGFEDPAQAATPPPAIDPPPPAEPPTQSPPPPG